MSYLYYIRDGTCVLCLFANLIYVFVSFLFIFLFAFRFRSRYFDKVRCKQTVKKIVMKKKTIERELNNVHVTRLKKRLTNT